MSSESEFANTTASARGDSVITDESSPRIIVFVAGAQSRVEAAADVARKLYPGHNLVFVCETIHCGWLSQRAGESIFVVEQPFNPFGRKASELRKSLEAVPIEACGLVIADIGHESFRFRVFALRLRTRRFLLLHGAAPNDSKQLDRLSFALLAGVTLLSRWPRKVRVSHHGSARKATTCLLRFPRRFSRSRPGAAGSRLAPRFRHGAPEPRCRSPGPRHDTATTAN